MYGFEDSEVFEAGLAQHVYEMDLPLVMSREAHIADWNQYSDYEWAEQDWLESIRQSPLDNWR